jgi:ribosomal protein L7/L12
MSFEQVHAERLDYIEQHLTQIAAAIGYNYVPFHTAMSAEVPPEVAELVHAGKTLKAIQRYRELTGVGLAEAQAIVQKLR